MFRLPFVWDDYTFLNDARSFTLRHLLPYKPLDPFYRPVSRDFYFSLLKNLGPNGPIVGHVLNAALIAAILVMLNQLVSRAVSIRAGVIASLVLASLGVLPFLIGWVSGCQDLLAIFFLMLAMMLRLRRRNVGAFVASALALFSKETASVFLPVIALLPWVEGKRFRDCARGLTAYGLLGVAWAGIHPGIHKLFLRHFGATETDYVGGVGPFAALGHLARYLVTVINLPQPGTAAPFPEAKLTALLLGIVAAALALRFTPVLEDRPSHGAGWPEKRVLIAGAYMLLAPLFLTAVIVQGWSPYYSAIAGLGLAVLAALALHRAPLRTLGFLMLPFVLLGVWQRGQTFEAGMTTERNFEETTDMLGRIEDGFRTLEPKLLPDSRVVVSVQVRGVPGIYIHIYHLQALREWYGDPTIQVVRPEIRRTRRRPEYFFIVTRDGQVAEINPPTLEIRPPDSPLDYSSAERAIRTYALGLYASGGVDQAVHLLVGMPQSDAGMDGSHRRLAAALLRASNRMSEADSLVRGLPDLPRDYVLGNIAAFIAETLPGKPIDRYVLEAFGFSWNDPKVLLWLGQWCERNAYGKTGLRLVRHYLELSPNDEGAKRLLRDLGAIERKRRQYDLPSEDLPPVGRPA